MRRVSGTHSKKKDSPEQIAMELFATSKKASRKAESPEKISAVLLNLP